MLVSVISSWGPWALGFWKFLSDYRIQKVPFSAAECWDLPAPESRSCRSMTETHSKQRGIFIFSLYRKLERNHQVQQLQCHRQNYQLSWSQRTCIFVSSLCKPLETQKWQSYCKHNQVTVFGKYICSDETWQSALALEYMNICFEARFSRRGNIYQWK